jgi:hypothetical protein
MRAIVWRVFESLKSGIGRFLYRLQSSVGRCNDLIVKTSNFSRLTAVATGRDQDGAA